MLPLPPVCWSGRNRQPTAAEPGAAAAPGAAGAGNTTGNSGCVRSAAQRRAWGARGGTARQHRQPHGKAAPGSRAARQQRHAAATQHRQPHGNGGNVFPQASPVFSFFGEGLRRTVAFVAGPPVSVCWRAGKRNGHSPPHAPHRWPRPRRRAGAPVATLEAGDPAATTEAPGERGRAGPRHRHEDPPPWLPGATDGSRTGTAATPTHGKRPGPARPCNSGSTNAREAAKPWTGNGGSRCLHRRTESRQARPGNKSNGLVQTL